MIKRKMMMLIPIALILVSCGEENSQSTQTNDSTEVVKTSSSSSQIASEETPSLSSTEMSHSEPSSTVSFNGSYSSVQGKYGEVIIVNKKHPLSPDYAPGENPEAKNALIQLIADMQSLGFSISNTYSGFRSYDYQASLYNTYVAQDGQVAADRYSARPGYSEHQTGLAFDLLDFNGNLLEDPASSQWLAENAHRYGFVVRYQAGKEASTGYMAETWHIRYIGSEATDIYHSGMTLEEYYHVPGGDYQ